MSSSLKLERKQKKFFKSISNSRISLSFLLIFRERIALKEPRSNTEIVIKKADKGTTTVIMNKNDNILEGQVQLDDKQNYTVLEA